MEEKKFKLPKIGMRIIKTLISCLIVALVYHYLLDGRNPCFACIGAVYGMGARYKDGFHSGFNRFVGTLIGGMMVIPFYYLCYTDPFGIPPEIYMVTGLFFVIYLNLLFGANNAIQPGTVVYFVVMYTQPWENYVGYTIARVIDTGVGIIVSLIISRLFPSQWDKNDKTRISDAFRHWKQLQHK